MTEDIYIAWGAGLHKTEHLGWVKLTAALTDSCLSQMQLFNVINLADKEHPGVLVVDKERSQMKNAQL